MFFNNKEQLNRFMSNNEAANTSKKQSRFTEKETQIIRIFAECSDKDCYEDGGYPPFIDSRDLVDICLNNTKLGAKAIGGIIKSLQAKNVWELEKNFFRRDGTTTIIMFNDEDLVNEIMSL